MTESASVIESNPAPIPDLDTAGTPWRGGRAWIDRQGFIGPLQPGTGPRRDPAGHSPSGPEVGQRLPDVRAMGAAGQAIDVHQHRDGKPAVMLFFRSAVW
ncbi:hypothetical protein [Candidatus Poriferisodalis sp.]|uniref:hypothetical protein n=1 Tax=Candidatus Poriferisodalis sp. TaxID=3101277 RepID=UPI003B52FD74